MIAERQVQPAARRALRRADRLHVQQRYAAGQGGSLSTQPVVHRTATARRRATRGRRRRSSWRRASPAPATRIRRSSTSTCRSSNAGGPARADADQPRQRQPDQPRALGARGRQPRQGGFEPARGHRRQPEGAHRAGHRNPVRDAGQREQPGDGAVQEGGAAPRRDAADHAGQPDHHDRRGPQGLGRPVGATWAAASRCRRSTPGT